MEKQRQSSEKPLTVVRFLYAKGGLKELIWGERGLVETTKGIPLEHWAKVEGEPTSGNEQELRGFRLTTLVNVIWRKIAKPLHYKLSFQPEEIEWFNITMRILLEAIDDYEKDKGVPFQIFVWIRVKQRLQGEIRDIYNRHPLGYSDQYLWDKINSVKEKLGSFKLTDRSFEKLRKDGVPDKILEGLQPSVNQEITRENTFLDAIEKQIGSEQTNNYKGLILKRAPKKPKKEITDNVYEAAIERLATLLGCSKEKAQERLLDSFGDRGVEQYDGTDPKPDTKVLSPDEENALKERTDYLWECIKPLKPTFRELYYRHEFFDEESLAELCKEEKYCKALDCGVGKDRTFDRRYKKGIEIPVTQRFFEHYEPLFKLSRQSLEKLKEENIPDNLLKDLEPLIDKEFKSENTFLEAVEKQVGADETARYKKQILKQAYHNIISDAQPCLQDQLIHYLFESTECLKKILRPIFHHHEFNQKSLKELFSVYGDALNCRDLEMFQTRYEEEIKAPVKQHFLKRYDDPALFPHFVRFSRKVQTHRTVFGKFEERWCS
jgi:hypothetical protein